MLISIMLIILRALIYIKFKEDNYFSYFKIPRMFSQDETKKILNLKDDVE